ncbi:hypothetical protein M6B38_198545 [Iris pallida]|uniref:Uncharacterized protein n=1 Tax=Iris pallida TaxID=29817 RepID=A0AAX6EB54_IRIPA|nr:hypothetical protein M6B38_198545 [Iris pallida]
MARHTVQPLVIRGIRIEERKGEERWY